VIVAITALIILVAVMAFVIITTDQRNVIDLSRDTENALRRLDREHKLLRERARMNS
jgi:hypothetical protein